LSNACRGIETVFGWIIQWGWLRCGERVCALFSLHVISPNLISP
jgi:hypothetical protein